MTTINNAVNNVYSSLKDSTNSNSASNTSALLDEMTGTQSVKQATKTAARSSYLLDLSPEAQAFLNLGSAGKTMSAQDSGFILTTKQQRSIAEVISKYADEPFTKETYDRIEEELDALGLSPDILAIKDKARGINTTSMLLTALNGTDDLAQALVGKSSTGTTDEQIQTKKDNYIKLLLGKWSDISTTIDADNGIDSEQRIES